MAHLVEDRGRLVTLGLAGVVAALAACSDPPPRRTYYTRHIEPILINSCAGNTSGCHRTNDEDPYGHAGGNFDVTSFENVQKRRDVLVAFGSYSLPLLLTAGKSVLEKYREPSPLPAEERAHEAGQRRRQEPPVTRQDGARSPRHRQGPLPVPDQGPTRMS